MINFFFEEIKVDIEKQKISNWILNTIVSEDKKEGEINIIFCKDEYLLEINQNFLDHNTYTDIITFDNSIGSELSGDIYISLERVEENAIEFNVTKEEELRRVMIHGILHMCGYKDKTEEEKKNMREKENEKLKLFHVEQ